MQNTKTEQPQTRKTSKATKIVAFILAFLITFIAGYFSRYIFESGHINTTGDLIRIIENFGYIVDENGNPRALTEKDYADALVNGLLDEYSAYYTKEEYDQIRMSRNGDASGYGVVINGSESEKPKILSVVGNSPAERAGLLTGDEIVSGVKNGNTVQIENGKQLSEFLTGQVGQTIELKVKRNGIELDNVFTVTKANYKKCYVEYYDDQTKMAFRENENGQMVTKAFEQEKLTILGSRVALISLAEFEGDVANQFQTALLYMKERGRDLLILDLRANTGGYMDILTEVASSLIVNEGKQTLIANAKSKTGEQNFYMAPTKNNDFINEIVVLADRNTASASECLIGAMIYYGEKFSENNLVIEGNDNQATTFGKGIMQTSYVLLNGGAFKLTTARIYQPDKTTCIHGTGFVAQGENATPTAEKTIIRALEILYT